MPPSPNRIDRFVVQNDSYELHQGELAHSSAATAAHRSTSAPPVSVWRKPRTGAARLRAQAVLPPPTAAEVKPDTRGVAASASSGLHVEAFLSRCRRRDRFRDVRGGMRCGRR